MLIFGRGSAHLRTVAAHNETCPSCGTHGSVSISIFRKHAHVFWIPVFPIGKTGLSECSHCKNVLEPKEMPESLQREYIKLRNESVGPKWQYAGLVVLALFISFIIYIANTSDKNDQEYLSAPLAGDVYYYKTEQGGYSTLKVMSVSADSVFVAENEFEISRMSKTYKIEKPENYSDYTFGLANSEIQAMYESGEIYNVSR